MLQILFHIIVISVICIAWGLPVLFFIHKKNQQNLLSPGKCFLLLFFAGLILLSVTSSWLVLFLPLQFGYLLILTFLQLVCTYFIHKKNYRTTLLYLFQLKFQLTITSSAILFTAILLFLVIGAARSVNIDTQMYHLQVIRWTNEYGTVPGLANIYPRLGLGSAWFNLISFFNISLFKNQNFTYLNCTLVLWFFFWLFHKFYEASKVERKNASLQLFYILLIIYFFFDWQLFRDTANSTSYDFIVTALIIICISLILEPILKSRTSELNIPAITIVALSVISFKVSGAFILILLIWKLYESKKRNNWFFAFGAGLTILLPVLIRNYIITGYPLYPLSFSISDPDWKMPTEHIQGIKNYIITQNRYYNTSNLAEPGIGFFSLHWIPFWFKGILTQHRIISIASLFSLSILFMKGETFKKIKSLIIILLIMSLGWFFTAPDPRFGYGFLLCLAFLPVSIMVVKYVPLLTYKIIPWIITAGICLYLYKKAEYIFNEPEFLIHTAQTQQPPYLEIKDDSLSFNHTEKINNNWNNRCFFTPLPCMCEKNPYVRFRGKSLKNGFLMAPIADSNFIKNYNY